MLFLRFFQLLVEFLNLLFLIADGLQQLIQFLILNRCRILLLHGLQEIRQHVHIIDKRVIGRFILRLALVDVIHVMQIVHILQTQPIGLQRLVLTQMYALGNAKQLMDSLLLQVITGIDT